MEREQCDVLVIGAGLAGLRCAGELVTAGLHVVVVDGADAVGGRVRTDVVEGFRLDRGFQLLNPAYPAVRRWVDIEDLRLGAFEGGVAARTDDGLERLALPWREPALLPATLRSVSARPGETLSLLRWAAPLSLAARGPSRLAARLAATDDVTLRDSLDRARVRGTLRRLLDRFFAGVLLDDEGSTSTHFALLLTWMFLRGRPGLPAGGMQALPEQLAGPLADRIRLRTTVVGLGGAAGRHRVVTDDGGVLDARAVVLAADAVSAAELLGTARPTTRGVVTMWWSVPEPPSSARLLHVDASSRPSGPLVNAAAMSAAQPAYAPPGAHLVQGSALLRPGAPAPDGAAMRDHAALLLGLAPGRWRELRRDEVPHALPAQPPPLGRHDVETASGIVLAGDHTATASLQGALVSGHRAARAVIRRLGVDAHDVRGRRG